MKNGENEIAAVDAKQMAIVTRLRYIALQQMRKTGYAAQFYTLQKTEVADEIFQDKAVIDKFNDLFSETAEGPETAKVEEFVKFCTVKIKHFLIDHMRRKFAEKRGGDIQFVPLDDPLSIFQALDVRAEQVDHIEEALDKLAAEHPFHAGIIENKYLLGMKNKELAEYFDVSLSKVEKDVNFAIAWLKRELSK